MFLSYYFLSSEDKGNGNVNRAGLWRSLSGGFNDEDFTGEITGETGGNRRRNKAEKQAAWPQLRTSPLEQRVSTRTCSEDGASVLIFTPRGRMSVLASWMCEQAFASPKLIEEECSLVSSLLVSVNNKKDYWYEYISSCLPVDLLSELLGLGHYIRQFSIFRR